MSINDNTPVLVGCGQVTQKISDPMVLNTALFKSAESLHQKDGAYLQLRS